MDNIVNYDLRMKLAVGAIYDMIAAGGCVGRQDPEGTFIKKERPFRAALKGLVENITELWRSYPILR